MAYTSPPVVVAGAIYTASEHNTYSVANIIDLHGRPANRCTAFNSGAQTVEAGNTEVLTMDSEAIDTASMHSTSSNTNRITIPSGGAGVYVIFGHSFVDSSSNGTAELQLRVDGTAVRTHFSETAGSNYEGRTLVVFAILSLTAAQYVELAGVTTTSDFTYGSATAIRATRLEVIGPLPPS